LLESPDFLQPIRDRQVILDAGQHWLLPINRSRLDGGGEARFDLEISWALAPGRLTVN
jgi:hypothetical protein